MINIAICDDDTTMQKALKNVLEISLEHLGLDFNIASFESGEQFLHEKTAYDIIFLDIEMGLIGGMQTAKEIRKIDSNCIIIFVTAFSDFVFQGYEVKALNYILKPFKNEKIKEVLEVALQQLEKSTQSFLRADIKGETQKINLSNTLYFISDKRKVIAVTKRELIEFYGKLDEIKGEIPSFFIRTHKRYIANLNYIDQLQADACVINGELIPISRSCSNDVILAFAKHALE